MAKKIDRQSFKRIVEFVNIRFQREILLDTLGGIITREHCRGISETIMKPSGGKME